jgi:hypothetical protein
VGGARWRSLVGDALVGRNSYAPPVSGPELRSARVGAMLDWPVNVAVGRFFVCFLLFSFFSGFLVLF